MKIEAQEFVNNGLRYIIRSADEKDAERLSEIRVQIDGETEFLDREKGESYINCDGFKKLIIEDAESNFNLFLVAEVKGEVVGFSRCEGNELKRTLHKVEFGVGVLKDYWGHGIGKKLLKQSICWADRTGIKKMNLSVIEINDKAIKLYKEHGFEVEGILRKDKLLSDGAFYNTILMGRLSF